MQGSQSERHVREPVSDNDSLRRVDPTLYNVVVQRWLHYDALLWQVPVLSLTGEAFLFTIALSAGNSQYARATASALAFLASLLSMHLMTRQRQAGFADARWLERYERHNFGFTFAPRSKEWWDARDSEKLGVLSKGGGYRFWMIGFGAFAVAALVTFIVTFAAPSALS